MGINLSILPHQTECVERVSKVFESVQLKITDDIFSNPIFDTKDIQFKENIEKIQNDFQGKEIPKYLRGSIDDNFGIDVRMETGTGKTYCYTRLMYEFNSKYGFHKFIILVPTTPIKEGTKSFIESDYAKRHFSDIYSDKRLSLSVLNSGKQIKGKKMFPQAISDFARGTMLEKGKISVLLMSSGMLLSKATMENEYDQTLFGTFSNPYDTLKATRPIVIIDEPHKFKRENMAYRRLIEKIDPLCVIRFGATFPNIPNTEQKDYNNLIFNLGSCEAFNSNLVKGVATQMIIQESLNETKVKLIEFTSSPKSCTLKDEKTGKNYTFGVGDSLSAIGNEFGGMSVLGIGKTENDDIKKGVTLSNGQILIKGDQIYAGIYGNTYQELMMKQAIKNHIEQEYINFYREQKIKTLSLFFIDSIHSYRGEDGEGTLRKKFQNILKESLEKKLESIKDKTSKIDNEYRSFIESSLKDIEATNGGYFAEDNSNSDEDIRKEVDQILRDKQSLLSFKDEKGNWNTRRFIFSKWTLREGWDNPNVFQICKLRSSGSEISKLQEVGRGLRLPVDEYGNRISDEQFYLTYLVDYSEKNFADSLINEIKKDSDLTEIDIKEMIVKVANDRGITKEKLCIELMTNFYIDMNYNIIAENKDKLIAEYPEFNIGLEQNKIINKNKKEVATVRIRENKFEQIRELWEKINQKYYLSLDDVSDEELYEAALDILKENIENDVIAKTVQKKISVKDGKFIPEVEISASYMLDESMPYGEFLKQIQNLTGLSVNVMHKALCEYNKDYKLKREFFNRKTIANFTDKFVLWFEKAFIERFSYKALGIASLETALTDINGKPRKEVAQSVVGLIKDDGSSVPKNFLYDKVIFDSPKEKESIQHSNIDEVIVFGKIPRRSIKVPLYFGGTTSPDFMYVIKKEDNLEINFIVETKDVDKESSLRGTEHLKIKAAKKFFETLKKDGINVTFEKQLKDDDIVNMINKLIIVK